MKIFIYAGNCVPFHSKSLEERALGGTETAIIRLSEEIQKLGHEVHIFTPHENPPAEGPVHFHSLAQIQNFPDTDVYISVRDWIPLFFEVQAKQRYFWTGDSYDQFSNYGIGDKRVVDRIDAFLSVSRWQADEICKRSGFPNEKCFVLGNGIQISLFQQAQTKKRKRLIYSSTPYRGLEFVPALFMSLKKLHPDLELHIFSSYSIYDQSDDAFSELRSQLEKLPDTKLYGSIPQSELAQEFLKSSILFYPCNFEETSCITAIEAMAAGCVPLTSALGALPETIGPAGVLIPGRPNSETYFKEFLGAAQRLLTDDVFFEDLSNKGKRRSQDFSWSVKAQNLLRFLENNQQER